MFYNDRRLNLRAGDSFDATSEVAAEEMDVRSQRVRSAPVPQEIGKRERIPCQL